MASTGPEIHNWQQPSGAELSGLLDSPLHFTKVELRVLGLPQHESFRSAVGSRLQREALLVRLHGSDGLFGIAECSARPDPYYNAEFLEGCLAVLRSFAVPAMRSGMRLAELQQALRRIRGWQFTTAAVLDAALDLLRRSGVPDLLDRWPGQRLSRIPAGISLGIFDDAASAERRVQQALAEGYRRIKLKCSPSQDHGVLRAAIAACADTECALDANGSFSEDELELVLELTEGVAMLEQPFAPDRLDLHARLHAQRPGLRLCLDESVHHAGELESAIAMLALTELNLKPGRVGGQLNAVPLLQRCAAKGLGCWIGGMFESGVGRVAKLRHAACLPQATAHDLGPSARYFERDILREPVRMGSDGMIEPGSEAPVELDERAVEEMTMQLEYLEPGR